MYTDGHGRSTRWRKQQLARLGVVTRLHYNVLCGDLDVTQPPLQWQRLEDSGAASERKAVLRHPKTCLSHPYYGLRTFDKHRLAECAGERLPPVARGPRTAQYPCDPGACASSRTLEKIGARQYRAFLRLGGTNG
jgi:hypothetical protein